MVDDIDLTREVDVIEFPKQPENGRATGQQGGHHTMMTSTGKAFDQNLTENASAPGRIPQGVQQECRAIYHDPAMERYWDCARTYLGHDMEWHRTRHPEMHVYEADVLYFETALKRIPEHWCWCLQAHHVDFLNDSLWDAQRKLTQYRNWRDNAIAYAKNGKQMGPRELTLTYSPDWYSDDLDAQEAFKKAVAKLSKYYANELLQFKAIGESHRSGRSHLHCMYRLRNGGKFTDKNLQRAYPHWKPKSNKGGHHSLVRSESDFHGYIEKDLDEAWWTYTYTANADDPARPETA